MVLFSGLNERWSRRLLALLRYGRRLVGMPRLRREDGQTIMEYAMLLSGVSVVLITFFIVVDLGSVFTTLVDNIEAALS
jgi:Flp pilus assembly pilin Flp